LIGVAESEVNDLDILVVIEQNILRLEVPVRYSEFLHVFESCDELVKKKAGSLF
jgi:hypothetical protein